MDFIKLGKDLSNYTERSRLILPDLTNNTSYNFELGKDLDELRKSLPYVESLFQEKYKPKKDNTISDQDIAKLKTTNARLILSYKDSKSNKQTQVIFKDFELPEDLNIKKTKAGPTYKFPGGIVTNQIMGDFMEPITWSGMLKHEDAYIRSQTLDEVFKVDTPVKVIYKSNKDISSNNTGVDLETIEGVIGELELKYKHDNSINYTITIKPHQNIKETVINRDTTFEELSVLIAEEEVTKTDEEKEIKEPVLPIMNGSDFSRPELLISNPEIVKNNEKQDEIFQNNKKGTVLIPKKDSQGNRNLLDVKANDKSFVIDTNQGSFVVGDTDFEYEIILQNYTNPLIRTKYYTNNVNITDSIQTKIHNTGIYIINKGSSLYTTESVSQYTDEELKIGIVMEMADILTKNEVETDKFVKIGLVGLRDTAIQDVQNNTDNSVEIFNGKNVRTQLANGYKWGSGSDLSKGYFGYILTDPNDIINKVSNPYYDFNGNRLLSKERDSINEPNKKTNPPSIKSQDTISEREPILKTETFLSEYNPYQPSNPISAEGLEPLIKTKTFLRSGVRLYNQR